MGLRIPRAASSNRRRGEPRVAEQDGPTRTSRALAIVHLAMYDAFVGIRGGPTYLSYDASEKPDFSMFPANEQAAVASAAALTLITLYNRQRDAIRQKHQEFLSSLQSTDPMITRGIEWGKLVAMKMIKSRQCDGSELEDNFYAPVGHPLHHRADPLHPEQSFLGPLWGQVKPFGIANLLVKVPGSPPPPSNHPDYLRDFNEVKSIGRRQSDQRTPEQTTIGLFWAYDGAHQIGVPPRMYNQIVRAIAMEKGTSEEENARLFALVNVAMADAGIQAWYEKYKYDFWRPVIGIREASEGYGPTCRGDGNPQTVSDPEWLPFGSPKTNEPGRPSFTPPFPSYPSGHATFGTAAIRVAQLELCLPDDFAFEFVSDEFNGINIDEDGSLRVRHCRPFTICRAIEENVASRVYLGVHWRFDSTEGKANGLEIARLIHCKFPMLA